MPAGGMRPNSHLPKAGAGRPKGSVDGVRRPGVKGGATKRRTQAEKAEDPFTVPGERNTAMGHQPDWIDDVQDLARGQRIIRDALRSARLEERMLKVMDRMLTDAENGDNKARELLLAYTGGRPVAFQQTATVDLTGDQLAGLAAQVRAEFDGPAIGKIA